MLSSARRGILGLILTQRERPGASPAVASLTATSTRLVRALADGSIGVLNAATTCASRSEAALPGTQMVSGPLLRHAV